MRNKILSIIILILLINYSSNAQQNYKVLFSKGIVLSKNKVLEKGDVFMDNDTLVFQNSNSLLKVCFSNCSKIKVIVGDLFKKINSESIKDYEYYYESMAVRGNSNSEFLSISEFLNNKKIGIFDNINISMDKKEFRINKTKYFFARLNVDGRIINKKLETKNNEIIFSKRMFENLISSNSKVSIYYYDSTKEISTLLTSNIQPFFIDKGDLKLELLYVLNDSDLNKEEKSQIIADFLSVKYPKTFISKIDLVKNFQNN